MSEQTQVRQPNDAEPLIRKYRRLAIAQSDLLDAYRFASYVVENDLHGSESEEERLTLKAFSLAMIVSYSRPFLGSSTDGPWPTTPQVQGRILRSLTSEERKFHDRLVTLRHDELAHSAAAAHDARLTLRTPRDGSAARIAIGVQRGTARPLSREETDLLQRLAEKVLGLMAQHGQKIADKLPDAERF